MLTFPPSTFYPKVSPCFSPFPSLSFSRKQKMGVGASNMKKQKKITASANQCSLDWLTGWQTNISRSSDRLLTFILEGGVFIAEALAWLLVRIVHVFWTCVPIVLKNARLIITRTILIVVIGLFTRFINFLWLILIYCEVWAWLNFIKTSLLVVFVVESSLTIACRLLGLRCKFWVLARRHAANFVVWHFTLRLLSCFMSCCCNWVAAFFLCLFMQ